MGRKVFVSYKYSDSNVKDLNKYEEVNIYGVIRRNRITTTARHYVDDLTEILNEDDQVFKGENDGESLETLADSTIGSKLGDKIFDSSVTLVLVSKGMRNILLPEKDQWIPWEVSYSLREQKRGENKSKTNGVIAVILPDRLGSYDYYITYDEVCNCRSLDTSFLFDILSANMFNVLNPERRLCNGSWVYSGDSSYIQSVKWDDFIGNPSKYIEKAIALRDRKSEFEIKKKLK